MSVQLSAPDFDRLVEILQALPEFGLPDKRVDFVGEALYPSPRRQDILGHLDLAGAPHAVAVRLINRLLHFGQDIPGREVLSLLIDKLLASYIGEGDKADFLRALPTRYPLTGPAAGGSGQASPPPDAPAPPSPPLDADPHLSQLRQQLAGGQVVLFIGGDLPAAVTGLPSRADLARALCAGFGLPPTGSLAEAAQSIGRRYEFTKFLRETLDIAGQQPAPFHRQLAALIAEYPVAVIITTAYDGLLELALRQAGLPFNRVVRSNEVAFISPQRPTLIKLYGALDQPETLTVTEDDHTGLGRNRDKENLLDEVRAALRRNTALFLGYNLADPAFKLLWSELLDHMGPFPIGATAVWPGMSAAEQRVWAERHIRVVSDDPLVYLQRLGPLTPPAQAAASSRSGPTDTGQPTPPIRYGVGNRWATLVGINHFEEQQNFPALHVCVNDARALHTQLLRAGYPSERVRLLADDAEVLPTRPNILAQLKSVADATAPDDLLLFFFSGHGDVVGNVPYLITRDSRLAVLAETAIPIAKVKQILQAAPARAKVILLDACHAGADLPGKAALPLSPDFIRRVFEEAEGLVILASSTQAQRSYEWLAQQRSVFTHYLLEALSGTADRDGKGFVTISDAARHVTDGVKLWASQHGLGQTPTFQATVAGEIPLAYYAAEPTSQEAHDV